MSVVKRYYKRRDLYERRGSFSRETRRRLFCSYTQQWFYVYALAIYAGNILKTLMVGGSRKEEVQRAERRG